MTARKRLRPNQNSLFLLPRRSPVTIRIDAWTHIFPQAYFARLQTLATASGPLKRWMELKPLYDLDQRFRLMDGFDGYSQILTPSMPPIEDLAEGEGAVD